MKTLLLFTLLSASNFSTVYAAGNHLYIVDLSGGHFESSSLNVMDDGIPAEVEGFALKLDGQAGRDFILEIKSSTPEAHCAFLEMEKNAHHSLLRLQENLQVDSGDRCNVEITYTNGKKAFLSIYSEGT